MNEMKARSRRAARSPLVALAALAASAALLAGLAGCRSEDAPPSEDAGAPPDASAEAPAEAPAEEPAPGSQVLLETPEPAGGDSSLATGGRPPGDGSDTASTRLPGRGGESISIAEPSAIALLLDSILAEGIEHQGLRGRASDSAYVARFAGDSLLAERFAARPRLPPGTRFQTTSDWLVTAADHRPGDPVLATLTDDVANPQGRVLVRRGAKFLGAVTEAQSALGPGEVPFLEVTFETLSSETWERPIRARVVALLPPEPPELSLDEGEADAGQAERLPGSPDSADANPIAADSAAAADPAAETPSALEPGTIPVGAVLVVELEEQLVLPMLPDDLPDDLPDADTPAAERDTSSVLDILSSGPDTMSSRLDTTPIASGES